jgi:predicted metal-dependent phosphoesterase TrpH
MARNYKGKIRCDLPFVQHFVLQPIERLILIILSIIFLALIGYAALSVPSNYFEDVDFLYGPYNVSEYAVPLNATFKYNIILDGHSHARHPIDDGTLTYEQNILWHIANGFNVAVITGHNTLGTANNTRLIAQEKYDDQIKIIMGMEYSNCRIHMNLINIEVAPPIYANPTDEQLQEVIDFVHAQGGLVTVNHFGWSLPRMPTHPTKQQLTDWGVDFFEVANGASQQFDVQSLMWIRDHPSIGLMSGTDMHWPQMANKAYTVLNAQNFTVESVMEELRAKRTSVIYDVIGLSGGERWLVYPESIFLGPLGYIGQLVTNFYGDLRGLYSFTDEGFCSNGGVVVYGDTLASFVFWILLFWLGGEILRIVIMEVVWPLIKKARKKSKFENETDLESK